MSNAKIPPLVPHVEMHLDSAALDLAVERLRAGGIVAFPTETVYGFGADANNKRAVARVFELKGRPNNNPLIVHVADANAARALTAAWPDHAELLAGAFWPGPLTIVLPKHPSVHDAVTAGGSTVALRCPDHPIARELLARFAGPLVGPSANKSGRVSPTTAAHVASSFSPEEALVLDGGPCRSGIESTVLSLASGTPRVLRPGPVSADAIAEVLGLPVEDFAADFSSGKHDRQSPLLSPGLLSKHYAPRSKTVLVTRDELAGVLRSTVGAVVVVSRGALGVQPPHGSAVLPVDAIGYAAGLYAALRAADDRAPTLIVVVVPWEESAAHDVPPEAPLWRAVMDRLRRATSA